MWGAAVGVEVGGPGVAVAVLTGGWGVAVGDGVRVGLAVGDGVEVKVAVGGASVAVGDGVRVGLAIGDGVEVKVAVGGASAVVGDGARVGLAVGDGVEVKVAVGDRASTPAPTTVSARRVATAAPGAGAADLSRRDASDIRLLAAMVVVGVGVTNGATVSADASGVSGARATTAVAGGPAGVALATTVPDRADENHPLKAPKARPITSIAPTTTAAATRHTADNGPARPFWSTSRKATAEGQR